MFYHETLRQGLLIAVALNFVAFALWALFHPQSLAALLGLDLKKPNGHSEFGAIYVGVFLGQALLSALAASRIKDATLGDLVAVFLLLQPLGRLVPLFRHGPPVGVLRFLFILELISGLALLAIRPDALSASPTP